MFFIFKLGGGNFLIRVLVVDQEKQSRRSVALTIDWAALGCMVVGEASNGVEGLSEYKRLKPDLIVTSIIMPEMDGIKMLKKLREAGSEVEVIILSACSEFDTAQKAVRYKAADYILKPLKSGELEASVLRIKDSIIEAKTKTVEVRKCPNNIILETKSKYVSQAILFIQDNFSDPHLNVNKVAKSLRISPGHLSRVFKRETGCTVLFYITQCRMHAGIELLTNCKGYKVYEVANKIGYQDSTYFSSVFKDIIGISPSEYQEVVREYGSDC